MAHKVKGEGPNKPRVFVYGTLKKGNGNHRALLQATFLGRCYIEGPYSMISLGWFPGIVDTGDTAKRKVFGEVYEVNDDILHTLDMIEGHPNFYTRHKVPTPWKNAWAYFLPPVYLNSNYKPLPEGAWNPSDEEKEFMQGTTNGAQ